MDTPKQSGAGKRKIKAIYFFVAMAVALALTWLLKEPSFTDSQLYVHFLFFFAMGLWLTEAIPAFAVSLLIMAYLVFALGNPYFNSAPEKIDKYVHTFSSSIIWLLLGGFFLAKAMTKTRFDERLLRGTLKISGTKPGNIVVAFMFTSMVMSMIMSNTAATLMLLATMMPLMNAAGRPALNKALLLGISTATATGGMVTIIGSPPNAVSAALLENNGFRIDFLEWMLYGTPVCLVLTGVSCVLLLRLFIRDQTPINLDFLKNENKTDERDTRFQRNVVVVVLIVTVLLWLTTTLHGISSSAISAIPIVVFTLTGIVTEQDVREMPWDVLILVAGSLSLGTALESTGILEHYSAHLRTMNLNPVAFLFIFAFMAMLLSNIMNNAAICTILLPLQFAIIPGFEKQSGISVALAASAALFLPISTPPNAIIYSTGLVEAKDFRVTGILIGLAGPVLAVLWMLLMKG